MDKPTFWVLCNLAMLRSTSRIIRHGCLTTDLESPSLPLKGWVYLWTLTLPTPDVTALQVASAWRSLRKNSLQDIPWFRGVRVFEPSPTGRWHVHIVTVERWNVRSLRSYALKHGWGRLNVKRIPANKASYVAKYLVKSRMRDDAKGVQLAATFGFKGIRQSDIEVEDTWSREIIRRTPQATGQFTPWLLRKVAATKAWLASCTSAGSSSKNMKIETKEHIEQALVALNKGEVICIGEYRGYKIDTRSMAVRERPDLKEDRVILSHAVEMAGSGQQVPCTEWMPPGTKESDIKVTHQQGDHVLVVCQIVSFKGGLRSVIPARIELLSKLLVKKV